jgi:hypothetical protein
VHNLSGSSRWDELGAMKMYKYILTVIQNLFFALAGNILNLQVIWVMLYIQVYEDIRKPQFQPSLLSLPPHSSPIYLSIYIDIYPEKKGLIQTMTMDGHRE